MYDRILAAVDHSEISDRAVVAARELAVLSKGEVRVLHLRERETGAKTGALGIDETTDDANAAVAAAVDVLAQAGVRAHGEVRNTIFGYAAREIINDAGDLAGLLPGSTAHKVIHLSNRPVLVVR